MGTNGGTPIYILYKIINSDSDRSDDSCFNAFPFHGGRPTLAAVKQSCAALYGLNHLGPEGYHWRVCVEDKAVPGEVSSGGHKTFSWWDIQDENASLPVKEATQYQLSKFFSTPTKVESGSDSATLAAKGAFKSLGKAVSQAVGVDDGTDHGPRIKVVAFKLLDLVKMHDEFAAKGLRGQQIPSTSAPSKQRVARPPVPAAAAHRPPPQKQTPVPPQQRRRRQQQQQYQRPQTNVAPTPQPRPPAASQATRQTPAEASLMDFGPSTPPMTSISKHLSATSLSSSSAAAANPNESRAEKLKREYAQKKSNSSMVWDDVDQRWVDAKDAATATGKAAPPPSNSTEKSTVVGISLDPANAAGKSVTVQAAVHSRVNEMRQSQAKALQEVREREDRKKRGEAEEDAVRKKLEPVVKAWSEEHGKKKQLRALLANLHTILWPEAQWKQVTIGDLLDDKKVKLAFHKASRVVHPDKTHHLDAEKRFLAKRIFDAISQAKTEFDNNGGK